MRATIIYDNESREEGLQADWGFACLVEAYGKRILFDTGAKGSLLLRNMELLKIDPHDVDSVFISHDHWDHTGGVAMFLDQNKDVKVYAPSGVKDLDRAGEVVCIDEPKELDAHFYTTGLLAGIEQSLVVETEKGFVIIVGCSHPGVDVILKAGAQLGDVYAVIGGLHGFDRFELIDRLQYICPTHCTQHIAEIRSLYPEKYIQGGAGTIIDM